TLKRFCCGDGGPASAEGIEYHVAFVGAGRDDSFEERFRLLGRIAEPFLCAGADRRNVGPQVLQRHAWHFVQIPLVLGESALGVDEPSLFGVLPHVSARIGPVAALVRWHALVLPARSWILVVVSQVG